jgi:hypothetical protein
MIFLKNIGYSSVLPALLSNSINNNIPQSVKKYDNAIKYRAEILKDNKGKSGVYIITNEINKKSYVGISYELAKRLGKYTNFNHINNYK